MAARARTRRGLAGVGLQIVRDWVLWFNAEGPDGLVTGNAPGAPSLLDGPQRDRCGSSWRTALSRPSMALCVNRRRCRTCFGPAKGSDGACHPHHRAGQGESQNRPRQSRLQHETDALADDGDRGRDDHYWSPPAQIPACGATAPGSYLGCVTRNRCSGHGCRMRGYGR
jgi:hypothetical protein